VNVYDVLRPLLFRIDPEEIHELVVTGLKTAQKTRLGLRALRRWASAPSGSPITVAGLEFPNRIGLAAGFDKNAVLVPAMAALGFGFVEVGTVTGRAQPGNPRPRMFRYPGDRAIVNRLGFNNLGAEAVAAQLATLGPHPVPVGINLGKSAVTSLDDAAAEYASSLRVLHAHGDYFTINISSPNTKDLRKLHEPARLTALLSEVGAMMQSLGAKPLFLKLSPDADDADLVTAAETAAQHGLGLIATNTTVGRTSGQAAYEAGGLSGAPLKARATAVVRLLRRAVGPSVPLIGVGGILDGQDVDDKLEAGADLVQIYTGFIYRGPGAVAALLRESARARA